MTLMNYDAKIDIEKEGAVAFDPLQEPGEEDRRSTRRMWIIGAVALLVLVGLWALGHFGGSQEIGRDTVSQAPVVTVTVPGRATIVGTITATGTLAARREMPVGAVGEGGQVERVLVEPGDWVQNGQVLAVINRSVQTQQQASLAAQVEVAQADRRLAQANLDRALQLVDRGFISQADVDRLTATRDAASARVEVAQAQLAEMRERTNRLDIVAPAGGLVLERNIEPGQVVGGGTGVLFSIAQGGQMEMLAEMSEDNLARLSVGANAEVSPVGSTEVFNGQVWQIAPIIDPQDRQGTVRIALPYDRALRPGGFATARVSAGAMVAPRLPESAILSDNAGSYVYIVGDDNRVARRNVQTGTITAEGVAVVEGLSGSERVVLRAGAFLSEGETVEPRVLNEP